jgi:hypothetical protein
MADIVTFWLCSVNSMVINFDLKSRSHFFISDVDSLLIVSVKHCLEHLRDRIKGKIITSPKLCLDHVAPHVRRSMLSVHWSMRCIEQMTW